MRLVSWRVSEESKNTTAEMLENLVSTAEQISRNQMFYDADIDIYGDFLERYNEIIKNLT